MKSIRQLFVGLLSAIATSLIVLGAGTLAFVEGDVNTAPLAALATQIPQFTNTVAPGEPTPMPVTPATPTATWVKFIQCNVPHGWQSYEVKPGDTLDSIAARFSLSAETVYQKNCLQSTSLPAGTILYLPAPTATPTLTPVLLTPTTTPTPTVTPTPGTGTTPCGPPPGWVVYVVRSGDTIYRLSVVLGINQNTLMEANCLTNPYLYVGQRLYVPFIPAAPPTRTPTPTDIPVLPSDTPVTTTPDLTATEAANQTATAAADATNAANQTATAVWEDTNAANQTATAEWEATNAANQTATAVWEATNAANQTATAEAANQTATSAALTATAAVPPPP